MSDTDDHAERHHHHPDPSQDADMQVPDADQPVQDDPAPDMSQDSSPADTVPADPMQDTSDQTDPASDQPQDPVPTDAAHQTLHDRFQAMEARLHDLEQRVGEHIGKLYDHIRRIGL